MGKLSHGALLACIFALLVILPGPGSGMVESSTTGFHPPLQEFALCGRGRKLVGSRIIQDSGRRGAPSGRSPCTYIPGQCPGCPPCLAANAASPQQSPAIPDHP